MVEREVAAPKTVLWRIRLYLRHEERPAHWYTHRHPPVTVRVVDDHLTDIVNVSSMHRPSVK